MLITQQKEIVFYKVYVFFCTKFVIEIENKSTSLICILESIIIIPGILDWQMR